MSRARPYEGNDYNKPVSSLYRRSHRREPLVLPPVDPSSPGYDYYKERKANASARELIRGYVLDGGGLSLDAAARVLRPAGHLLVNDALVNDLPLPADSPEADRLASIRNYATEVIMNSHLG